MKRIITVLLVSISLTSFSQGLEIQRLYDEMRDITRYTPTYNFKASEDGFDGFVLSMMIDSIDNSLTLNKYSSIYVSLLYSIDGVSCSENISINFKFADGTLLKTKSETEFNCDGSVIYKFNKSELNTLSTKKIIKVMIQDGRSYTSLSQDITEDKYSYYFRDLLIAMDSFKLIK